MSREEKMRARVMVWELTVILEASEEGGRERRRENAGDWIWREGRAVLNLGFC